MGDGVVLLIATGGTIASRPGPTGAVAAAMTGDDLLASVPDVDAAAVDVTDLARGSSWNFTPALMAAVATTCREALNGGRATGVVVTHGTDTLEETLWLTELLAGRATDHGPVVFTAAMRNSAEVSVDGPANLRDALSVARAPTSAGRGALLCVNGELHAARWATKTDATALSTFRSPAAGPVGRVVNGRPVFHHTGPSRGPEPGDGIDDRVALIRAYGGIDSRIVDFHIEAGVTGVVVEGAGSGNVYESLVPGLVRAMDRGLPVVLTSRCQTGAVTPIYGGPGGGIELAAAGVIPGGDLGGLKARLALMVALARDPDADAVRAWFAALVGP